MTRSILVLTAALALVVFLTVALVVEHGGDRRDRAARSLASNRNAARGDDGPAVTGVVLAPDQELKEQGLKAFANSDFAAARDAFRTYLDRHPDMVESYTNLAVAWLSLNQALEAEAVALAGLEKTGGREPGPFHFILACAYHRLGRAEESTAYLRQAYSEVGREVLVFARKEWAAPLQSSPAFRELQEQLQRPPASPPALHPPASP